jgi:hypothetical protein
MMNELPQMLALQGYASNTLSGSNMQAAVSHWQLPPQQLDMAGTYEAAMRRMQQAGQPIPNIANPLPKEAKMAIYTRRLVQVFIADTDDNVPLAQCLLHSGTPKLTDLTDQELFYEVDVKTLLDNHNDGRVKLVNKAVKERVEYLETARIRDLKMTVVTIAQF